MASTTNDKRLVAVNQEEEKTLNQNNTMYNSMIKDSQKYYDKQIDASKDWVDKQSQLQQEQTDFAIEKIEQQKDQANKDYVKEQSGAYVDWQKESNRYGANAEQMAASGFVASGYGESSQVSMYNTYQNRVATAREVYNKAVLNYDNAIKDARLQNSSVLAEIAYKGLQQQLELGLQGLQYKNQLLESQANKQLEIKNMYHQQYQDVLNQINTENALAEEIRQFNKSYDLQLKEYNEQIRQFNKTYDLQLKEYNEQIRQFNKNYELQIKEYNEQIRQFNTEIARLKKKDAQEYSNEIKRLELQKKQLEEEKRQFDKNATLQKQQFEKEYKLKQQQMAEEKRQYDASLKEEQRQYNSTIKEEQRQYNSTLKEEQRQYNNTLSYNKTKSSSGGSGGSGAKITKSSGGSSGSSASISNKTGSTTGKTKSLPQPMAVQQNNKKSYAVNTPYYQGALNSDAKLYGTFSNGYQPKGIFAHGTLKKTGDTISVKTQTLSGTKKTVTQNVWKAQDGTKWYWEGRQNKYIQIK